MTARPPHQQRLTGTERPPEHPKRPWVASLAPTCHLRNFVKRASSQGLAGVNASRVFLLSNAHVERNRRVAESSESVWQEKRHSARSCAHFSDAIDPQEYPHLGAGHARQRRRHRPAVPMAPGPGGRHGRTGLGTLRLSEDHRLARRGATALAIAGTARLICLRELLSHERMAKAPQLNEGPFLSLFSIPPGHHIPHQNHPSLKIPENGTIHDNCTSHRQERCHFRDVTRLKPGKLNLHGYALSQSSSSDREVANETVGYHIDRGDHTTAVCPDPGLLRAQSAGGPDSCPCDAGRSPAGAGGPQTTRRIRIA